MTIREKVKGLCAERGISIYKLEKDLGISSGSVKHWDTSMPSGDKILSLSRYFGVPNIVLVYSKNTRYSIAGQKKRGGIKPP